LETELDEAETPVDCDTVARALPAGAALIEYARFSALDFGAAAASLEQDSARDTTPAPRPARYLAFVLRAGAPESPRLIDLGEVDKIDRLISVTRLALIRTEDLRPAAALREAAFDLPSAVAGCKQLFLAFDGELVHVPFDALPTDNGGTLSDAYFLHGLTTGRDLLLKPKQFGPASASLVAGDPDFDLDVQSAQIPEPPAPSRTRSWLRSLFSARRAPASAEQQAKPGTKSSAETADSNKIQFRRLGAVETEAIARQLGVQPWLGRHFLKNRLMECRSPRILHVAAPGFFLNGPARVGVELGGTQQIPRRDKLLLRSGLALTGANSSINGAALPPGAGDGLLTTLDVAGLDLTATDLVVLPACGAGPIEVGSGPGVVALERAFLLAGARTVVLTLWQPPADVCRDLLADFYRRVLAGEPKADALRAAQRAAKAKNPDPRGWAAFVAVGH
jgi:hypothetical protein